MDELEDVRERKLAELKQKALNESQQQEKLSEAEMQLNLLLRQVLEPEAKSRLNNVRMVNAELFSKTVQAIVYLYNGKKLSGKLSDSQLKALLERLSSEKREIEIKRK